MYLYILLTTISHNGHCKYKNLCLLGIAELNSLDAAISYNTPYPKLELYTNLFYFNGFLFGKIYFTTCNHFKNHREVTNVLKKPILINFSQLYLNMEFFLRPVQLMFLNNF